MQHNRTWEKISKEGGPSPLLGYPVGRKLGSMVGINGLFHPLILTFDPNFLGHPSGWGPTEFFCGQNMKLSMG